MGRTRRRSTWAEVAVRPWPPEGLATRWARRVLTGALCAAVLLAAAPPPGTPVARVDAARPDRPPGPAAPDPAAPPGPDAPGPPRSGNPPGSPNTPPDGPVPAPPEGAGIPAPGARYAWPLLPVPAIAARFRAPPHPYGRGHRGVDLVGAPGRPVLAARSGTVVFAGAVGSRSVVSVDHDDGLRTTYEPVRPSVRAGAVVRAGDVLGLLEAGHAGCPAAACLHWGVRRGLREYLDPLVLVRPPAVRLLPVADTGPWPAGFGTARGPPAARVGRAPSAIVAAAPGRPWALRGR